VDCQLSLQKRRKEKELREYAWWKSPIHWEGEKLQGERRPPKSNKEALEILRKEHLTKKKKGQESLGESQKTHPIIMGGI